MKYRTSLAQARGLGAAGQGSGEWWRQRLGAIALIPLTLWVAPYLVLAPGRAHAEVVAWIQSPWNSLFLWSLIVLVFYHAIQGLQVVIEDYVDADWIKIGALIAMKLMFSFLGLAALYATFRILVLD
jgi:succinate dehydrogenase / fumarate reductase membrane anchor subunit